MRCIENVFLCLAAPLLMAVFCVRAYQRRTFRFVLSGMAACLCSSYISTFFARILGASPLEASLEISPVIEEILKLLPVVFYFMVYEPKKKKAAGEALMVAVGFATLENTNYLISSDIGDTLHLMIRGFSTGVMHVICGAIVATVLQGMWNSLYFRVIATLGVLCVTITFHGIYNILVNQQGIAADIGYALPVLIGMGTILVRRKQHSSEPEEGM